jgi:hypothetical protein
MFIDNAENLSGCCVFKDHKGGVVLSDAEKNMDRAIKGFLLTFFGVIGIGFLTLWLLAGMRFSIRWLYLGYSWLLSSSHL